MLLRKTQIRSLRYDINSSMHMVSCFINLVCVKEAKIYFIQLFIRSINYSIPNLCCLLLIHKHFNNISYSFENLQLPTKTLQKNKQFVIILMYCCIYGAQLFLLLSKRVACLLQNSIIEKWQLYHQIPTGPLPHTKRACQKAL